MLQRHTGKSIIIGSVIVGISMIIAFNFAQFVEWTHDAIYHLSGQAAADKREEENRVARLIQQQAAERAREQQERAREQQEWQQEREQKATLKAAWEDYLTSNKIRFKQIDIVRDTVHGDYSCLRDPSSLWDNGAKQQAIAAWTYDVRDRVADGFVQWLNSGRVLGRTDWKYDELKDMQTYAKLSFSDSDYHFDCLWPGQVWRANRYQRRIE